MIKGLCVVRTIKDTEVLQVYPVKGFFKVNGLSGIFKGVDGSNVYLNWNPELSCYYSSSCHKAVDSVTTIEYKFRPTLLDLIKIKFTHLGSKVCQIQQKLLHLLKKTIRTN